MTRVGTGAMAMAMAMANGGGGGNVDPPLLMTYASHETRPLTLKETRLIMSM